MCSFIENLQQIFFENYVFYIHKLLVLKNHLFEIIILLDQQEIPIQFENTKDKTE